MRDVDDFMKLGKSTQHLIRVYQYCYTGHVVPITCCYLCFLFSSVFALRSSIFGLLSRNFNLFLLFIIFFYFECSPLYCIECICVSLEMVFFCCQFNLVNYKSGLSCNAVIIFIVNENKTNQQHQYILTN